MKRVCSWFRPDGSRCRRKATLRVDAYDVCRRCAEEDRVLSQMLSHAIELHD